MPKIKPHLIKSSRFMFRMTPSEHEALKRYCASENKAVTTLFRDALSEYCDKHNIKQLAPTTKKESSREKELEESLSYCFKRMTESGVTLKPKEQLKVTKLLFGGKEIPLD